MAKVKKAAGVTGERNIKRSGGASRGKAGKSNAVRSKPKARTQASKTARSSSSGGKASGRKAKSATRKTVKRMTDATAKNGKRKKTDLRLVARRAAERPAPVVRVAVKPLDPIRKCGLGTSVQFLYRVDETVDGRNTPHLVFFDRHGWYCEHGRTCPAVGHAKKFNGQIARVS